MLSEKSKLKASDSCWSSGCRLQEAKKKTKASGLFRLPKEWQLQRVSLPCPHPPALPPIPITPEQPVCLAQVARLPPLTHPRLSLRTSFRSLLSTRPFNPAFIPGFYPCNHGSALLEKRGKSMADLPASHSWVWLEREEPPCVQAPPQPPLTLHFSLEGKMPGLCSKEGKPWELPDQRAFPRAWRRDTYPG